MTVILAPKIVGIRKDLVLIDVFTAPLPLLNLAICAAPRAATEMLTLTAKLLVETGSLKPRRLVIAALRPENQGLAQFRVYQQTLAQQWSWKVLQQIAAPFVSRLPFQSASREMAVVPQRVALNKIWIAPWFVATANLSKVKLVTRASLRAFPALVRQLAKSPKVVLPASRQAALTTVQGAALFLGTALVRQVMDVAL
jgi:hypothetical protein